MLMRSSSTISARGAPEHGGAAPWRSSYAVSAHRDDARCCTPPNASRTAPSRPQPAAPDAASALAFQQQQPSASAAPRGMPRLAESRRGQDTPPDSIRRITRSGYGAPQNWFACQPISFLGSVWRGWCSPSTIPFRTRFAPVQVRSMQPDHAHLSGFPIRVCAPSHRAVRAAPSIESAVRRGSFSIGRRPSPPRNSALRE